ncbi:hypothetical protein SAMD00019534_053350 [Acytostelium subglobosum LB1]|uniref:hypothetical protein n=1 Tax=Acytostelium subglobosum LB1 TaxID=1410327 RepID=UPI000644CA3B|nr:hypothetical protein SAMD00019534_053350 [Acytostelium subglobosum LB1]GAM22160.1 hypothetical protein SAMD00019534_053350 [Acytostelium subglobosum LB1]|eukprot:XP_012755260.1 hypothetical protein SAMD00019534_053350 [Acytostelium subglobosum LB1]
MAVFCEIDEVVEQIRYKTQMFYESLKRDSIAEQLYNFSNDDSTNDQSIPYSKSLEKDYSNLIYVGGNKTPTTTTGTTITTNNSSSSGGGGSGTTSPVPPPSSTINNNNTTVKPPPSTQPTTTTTTTQVQQTQQAQPQDNNKDNTKPTCKIVTFSASQSSKPSELKGSMMSAKSNNNNPGSSVTNNSNTNTNTINKNIINNNNNNSIKTTGTTTNNVGSSVTSSNNNNSNSNSNSNNSTNPSSNNTPVFLFVKETLSKSSTNTTPDSLLTKLVRPSDSEKDLFAEYGEIIPPPGMGMQLSIHTGIGSIGMLRVRVVDKATVIQSIAAALKTYFSQQNQQPQPQQQQTLGTSVGSTGSSGSSTNLLYPDPKAYFLRIADDDGKIDEDYPTLDPNQQIYKFKDEVFVLCLNQKYEAERRRSSSGVQPRPTSLAVPQDKVHLRRVSVGTLDTIALVKITLPDSSITKVAYQPDMKLKELLMNTCKKRKLIMAEHHFEQNGSVIDPELTLDKLTSLEIVLVSKLRRSMSGDGTMLVGEDNTGDHEDIFWYDLLAYQYKQYEVVKLKKYGSKQERIIGIDKERITNMSPNLKKEQETKRPTRMIKDIAKVALAEKPKHFTIEYIDGKTYLYEAKSHPVAAEIVGKIHYILKSHHM